MSNIINTVINFNMLGVLTITAKFVRLVKVSKIRSKPIKEPVQQEKTNQKQPQKEQPPKPLDLRITKEHLKQDRLDPKQAEQPQLARIRLSEQHLPRSYLKRVQQVFHKYQQSRMREVADLFSELMNTRYKEKKFDYTQVLPFERYEEELKTEDKVQKIYLGSKEKVLQIASRQEQKAPKKDEDPIGVTNQYTQNVTMSYLLKRVPRTFASAIRIFLELQFRYPKFKPTSMIDFGSGLSSGSLAFSDVFGDSKEIFNIEPSSKMHKLSKFLVQDTDIQHFKSLGEIVRLVRDVEIVYVGYVLSQLESQMIPVYLEALYNKVRPGGFLILAEYGNPFGARLINDVRNWARDRKIKIVAPCPHQEICPLSKEKRWCHFDQPAGNYPRGVFGRLPTDQAVQSEKFSYLILRKSVEEGTTDFIVSQRTEMMEGWDRVVFPTIKKGGHLMMDLCTTRGTFEKRTSARSHGEQYKEARRLRWGDLWRFGRRIPNRFRKQRKYGKRVW